MKYLFNILNKTYCNLLPVEIHKMLNFPSICSGHWDIFAKYDLRATTPYWGINPYGDKKAKGQMSD